MKQRRKESGFALLLVFLLAACVAIMLYAELPRVAFEAERQKELLLIDRGNQFKRAIQVFITDKTNNPMRRYPASLDELESFNNHRYLRRRYVDPMTGKDEWRLVHINGGVLTDSVTTKATTTQSTSTTPNPPAYISEQSYMDTGAGAGRGGGATRALGRRPSDSLQPGAPGDPGTAGGSQGMQGFAGGSMPPGMPPPNQSLPGGIPGQPGMPVPMPTAPAQQPCNVYIGGCPTTPANPQGAQPVPMGGLPGQPGNPVNSQTGGVAATYPTTPGSNGAPPGFAQPGMQMNQQAQSAAASMIQGLLTTPRPGGMPTNMPGSSIGGGIAGVASKFEADGIMVINERTAINEWEYIFDANKYRVPPNPISGTVGTPLSPMGPGGGTGTPIGTPIGSPVGAPPGALNPMGPLGPGGGRGQ